eukprot:TRINITY_DN2362_c0_g2_i1.p1 TRINITY_DN2362_c0_g2~~TRINITY_DN2362_c0_g2_i1.p1  ORF type:complete len:136 (-),score=13.42 TRINITY_DN2362_c0_g2_i1:317-724(-)
MIIRNKALAPNLLLSQGQKRFCSERCIREEIKQQLNSKKCVAYIKGSSAFPLDLFSRAVVDALDKVGADYVTYNVLDDQELRAGIKQLSSFPTIPQVFIDGVFVGGCDMVLSYYCDGELYNMVRKDPNTFSTLGE